ncbi:MAG: hypothetical protein V4772_09805 [Pseudomonadota bacterium]
MATHQAKPFSPGFRMSLLDGAVLLVGIAASAWAAQIDVWLGLLILFTVGHFFLFCNIVRMARALELVWTAIFLLLAVCSFLLGWPGLPVVFALTLGLTGVLVFVHARRPSYHGVFWQRINPGLPDWWAKNGGGWV